MTANFDKQADIQHKNKNSWKKLKLFANRSAIDSAELPQLSAHVLNLRRELQQNNKTDSTDQKLGRNQTVFYIPTKKKVKNRINLAANPIKPTLPDSVSDLTFLWMFELVGWLATSWWRLLIKLFLSTFQEAICIFESIKYDVINFFGFVYEFIAWPIKKVKPRKFRAVDSFLNYTQDFWDLGQVKWLIVVALIIIVPIKVYATWQVASAKQQAIINLSQEGVSSLQSGSASLLAGDTEQAEQKYKEAADKFSEAQRLAQIIPVPVLNLLAVIPGKAQQITGGVYLVSASKELAIAASSTLGLWHDLSSNSLLVDLAQDDKVEALEQNITTINNHLTLASLYLDRVQADNIPEDVADQVLNVKDELKKAEKVVASLGTIPDLMRRAFVTTEPKRYLLIFQNNSEMRATGGFMGSLAFVDINSGKVESFTMPGGGPYDFQGQIKKIIRPPEPIRLVRGTWQLQDSNWWFDFPTSAQKVMWFIKQSDGPDVDGVLAMTPDVVIELLKLTGPIELKKYNKTITADNFMRTTQLAVDVEYDKAENKPKQFLVDLAPILMDRVINLSKDKQVELVKILQSSLLSKSFQLYFVDDDLQKQVENFGWSGEVKNTSGDYLAVVHTNIGGGKTDLVTSEQVDYKVNIDNVGQVVGDLTITRQHNGSATDIFEKRRNVDYMRIYVPRGSVLLSADGFTPPPDSYFRAVPGEAEVDFDLVGNEDLVAYHQSSGTKITEEFGKTVFANWLSVAPGEKKTIHLTYKLPFILKSGTGLTAFRQYQLFLQRQPGMQPVDFKAAINFPQNWRVRWQESSAELDRNDGMLNLKTQLLNDDYLAVLFDNKIQ